MDEQTPSQGLKILKQLNSKYDYNQNIKNQLINAYIKLGYHDIALKMINDISDNKTDIQTLKFKAWALHKHGNVDKERQCWDKILEKHFLPQVHNKIDTLLLRSNKEIKLELSDIPLFCIERNEMLRLPFFLEYYRDLGVTQFVFVDNNSTDGSLEFLLQQEDCHVFWTNDSYSEAGYGVAWLNYLINYVDILIVNQWYLVADVDEFLVYPNCEKNKLVEFIAYLNQEQVEAVPAFMLDMYPKKLSDDEVNTSCFLKQHNYFYNNYQKFYQIESPYIKTAGGIRTKLFSEHNNAYVKTALFKKTKYPCTLLSSTHQLTPCKISKISSVFLHYKFSGNLKQISANEMKRKQHSGGASRYRHYYQGLTSELYFQNLSELPKSTRYKNSQQLVDLGLISSPYNWIQFIQKKGKNND